MTFVFEELLKQQNIITFWIGLVFFGEMLVKKIDSPSEYTHRDSKKCHETNILLSEKVQRELDIVFWLVTQSDAEFFVGSE